MLKGFTLSGASQGGHLEIVKLFLSDDRVDPSALNSRALTDATKKRKMEDY